MWASTRCPFCSSTRNIALGSGSTTRPSTSMAPSFFAMPNTASLTRWCWWCGAGSGLVLGHARSRRDPAGTYVVGADQVVPALPRGRPASCGHSTTTRRREHRRSLYPGAAEGSNPARTPSCSHLAGPARAPPVDPALGAGREAEGGQARDAAVLGREDPRALGRDGGSGGG